MIEVATDKITAPAIADINRAHEAARKAYRHEVRAEISKVDGKLAAETS